METISRSDRAWKLVGLSGGIAMRTLSLTILLIVLSFATLPLFLKVPDPEAVETLLTVILFFLIALSTLPLFLKIPNPGKLYLRDGFYLWMVTWAFIFSAGAVITFFLAVADQPRDQKTQQPQQTQAIQGNH